MVMGPTHATSGAVAWLAGAGLVTTVLDYPQSPGELAVYTAVCAGAALLPDLDVSGQVFKRRGGATAARTFGIVTLVLAEGVEKLSLLVYKLTKSSKDPRRRYGHRTFTHTFAFAVLLGALVSVLVAQFGRPVVLAVLFFTVALAIRGIMAEWARKNGWLLTTAISAAVTVVAFSALTANNYPLLGVAIGLGCAVHILGDLITHHGCPIFWPFRIKGRAWYMITTPKVVSVKAGGGFEKAVLLPGLTIATCAAAVWQVPEVAELVRNVTGTGTGTVPPEAGDP